MRKNLSDAEAMGIGIGALVAVAVAGLLGAFRGELNPANGALVLVLVVIVAAATRGRGAGVAPRRVAAGGLGLLRQPPGPSLAIKSSDDVVTTILLVVVGLAVGTIATDRWEARAHGRAGTEEVAGLYRVAGLTADGADTATVVRAVEEEVASVLHLRECRFARVPADPPVPVMDPSGRIATPYLFEGDGFALPAEGVALPVNDGDHTLGWLICQPSEGCVGVSRDRRRAGLALASFLALALAVRDSSRSDGTE